jgi:hypothetical protein
MHRAGASLAALDGMLNSANINKKKMKTRMTSQEQYKDERCSRANIKQAYAATAQCRPRNERWESARHLNCAGK